MTELFREGMIARLVAEFGSPDIEDVTFEVTDPDGAVAAYRFGADRVVAKMQETLPNTCGFSCYVSLKAGNWSYKASGRLMGLEIFTRGEFFVHALPSKYGVKAYATPVEGVPDLPPAAEPEVEKKYKVEGDCVYKENADGSLGEKLKCYEGEGAHEQAVRYHDALYANVPDAKKDAGLTAVKSEPPLAEAVETVLKALTPRTLREMDEERRKAVVTRLRAVIQQVSEPEVRKSLHTRLSDLGGEFVVKQIGGKYRWFGRPSLNVEDRVGETASKVFLTELVEREKGRGNYPRLEFFHTNFPVGYTDDYRVVDGIMVATGGFNDDPASQTVAKYYVEHPEGTDGTGWAMSWRFRAKADPDGVYRKVSPTSRIREFTFLPTSQAALPITQFDLKEVA